MRHFSAKPLWEIKLGDRIGKQNQENSGIQGKQPNKQMKTTLQ